MAWVGTTVTARVLGLLTAENGLNACVATLALAAGSAATPLGQNQIAVQNVSCELAERSMNVTYPSIHIYCEKIVNQLREKFRDFSGKAVVAVEVRVTQDQLEGIENQLELYLDAATQVLDQNRGDWGEGMYFAGCYEASLSAAKHGGLNFVQAGKITFEVGVSS